MSPLFLAGLAAATQAAPQPFSMPADGSSLVAVMCDPVKYRFSIRADATAASLDHSYPIAKLLRVDDLYFAGGLPGWTNQTDVQAPLIQYERCGPYTFKFEGDAYNLNVQGESGAYPGFAAVSILRADRMFQLPVETRLRLTPCDRTLRRAEPCPKGYAIRVEGRYDAGRRQLHFVLTIRSYDGAEDRGVVTAVERIDVGDDLEMWVPD